MKQIELMIIGAQKAGTTSLHKYLAQHPSIYTHFSQEFGLFKDLDACYRGFDYYYRHTVSADVKKDSNKKIFIPKHVGLMYDPVLLSKLKEFNPGMKIVIVLRNPVDRAFSAFKYCRSIGIEPYKSFEDAVFINDPGRFKGEIKHIKSCDYISRSSYFQHIKNVYSFFPPENVHLFLFEEMIVSFNETLNSISKLVGAGKYEFDTAVRYNETTGTKYTFISKLFAPAKNKTGINILPLRTRVALRKVVKTFNSKTPLKNEKVGMESGTRQHLINIFREDVLKLQGLAGLPLSTYWPAFFI